MKKIIKILQSNVEPLIIEDIDDTNLTEYSQNLSKLLSAGHVSIIETSSGANIIRPQKIVSITITEEGKPKRKYTKKKDITEIVEAPKELNIEEDIITDG